MRLVGPDHECEPFKVGRFPVVTVGAQDQMLLVPSWLYKEGPALTDVFCDHRPEFLPDARADVTDEDPGCYFHQPTRQLAAESAWGCCKDEGDHSSGSPS